MLLHDQGGDARLLRRRHDVQREREGVGVLRSVRALRPVGFEAVHIDTGGVDQVGVDRGLQGVGHRAVGGAVRRVANLAGNARHDVVVFPRPAVDDGGGVAGTADGVQIVAELHILRPVYDAVGVAAGGAAIESGDQAVGRIEGAVDILGDVGQLGVVRVEEGEVARLQVILPHPIEIHLRVVGNVPRVVVIGIAGVHPADVGAIAPELDHGLDELVQPAAREHALILHLHRGEALLVAVAQKAALLAHRVYELLLRVYGQRLFHQTPHGVERGVGRSEGRGRVVHPAVALDEREVRRSSRASANWKSKNNAWFHTRPPGR